MAPKTKSLGPIVSSAHLADGTFPEVSEFEFGLIVASHAFQRWVSRAMSATGQADLSAFEVLVLHTVRHLDRPKTLADICLVLNVEDTHTVNYAVRKLKTAGLVIEGRKGKEKTVAVTDSGKKACKEYKEVREKLLLDAVLGAGLDPDQVRNVANVLRFMSGQYDQAARAATVL